MFCRFDEFVEEACLLLDSRAGIYLPISLSGWSWRGLPFGDPLGQVAHDLGKVTSVIEPSEFHQAIGVDLARHVVERVSEEVNIIARDGQGLSGILCVRP